MEKGVIINKGFYGGQIGRVITFDNEYGINHYVVLLDTNIGNENIKVKVNESELKLVENNCKY